MILKQTLIACSAVAAIASLTACSNSSYTTTGNFRNQGYLMDSAGSNSVVKSLGYDVCVRTSDWTPARAIIECDPDLVPKPVVKAPVAAPKVEAPAPKVVAAPPPPPPPKPTTQSFTLSADALFDFDKATLKPEGRKKLDELADALRGTAHDTITATGHTDRAGSVSYNQRLSESRAQAVKKYLESKGLNVGKIVAVGKGKSETTVKPTDCKTPGMTRAAILACLQPDRRVVIDVTGTRNLDPNAAPAPKKEATPEAKPAAKVAPKAKAAAKAKAKPKVGE